MKPDNTAVRVALWRAMHVQIDPLPHVLQDEIGLQIAAPDEGWRRRPDMDPSRTSRARATVVARSRFIEDLAVSFGQYVLLGAGLDTFVQRRPDITSKTRVFEVDQPAPQAWKRQRLIDLQLPLPAFVAVDFEKQSWLEELIASGFDMEQPALVASSGVSMYLTRDANAATLQQVASLARGSTFIMTFQLPTELIEAEERPMREATEKGARGAGTPFISYYKPGEIIALAREAGFTNVQHVSSADLTQRFFAGRSDGLRPSSAEELIVATR